MNLKRRVLMLLGPVLLLPRLARAADNGSEAGTVQLVDGQVRVRNAAGTEHAPAVGGKLFEGDTIVTGGDGELHAEMIDGGVIGLRPSTSLTLTKYQANGDKDDGAFFSLLRGGFRSITGWVAQSRPVNYKIISSTATIGVRGTDHEPHVIEAGSSEGEPGLYDHVNAGGTFIQGPTGRVDVAPGKVGFFSLTARTAPRLLASTPGFFRGSRHEDRFNGLHDRVMRSLQSRRTARIMQVREERRQRLMGARPGMAGRAEGAAPKRGGLLEKLRERREENQNRAREQPGEGLRRRRERE